MMFGPKTIENRKWAADYMVGETFAMHASAKWDRDGERFLLERGVLVPPRETLPTGAIIGTSRMTHCIKRSNYDLLDEGRKRELIADPAQEDYFFGPYGFVLPEQYRRPIAPIEHPGSLGFFQLPDVVVAELVKRLALARSGDSDPVAAPTPVASQQSMPWEPPGGLRRRPRLPRGRK